MASSSSDIQQIIHLPQRESDTTSHLTDPIQIPRAPRRRLLSEGSLPSDEFSQDSGFFSPLHSGRSRQEFNVSGVILEDSELDDVFYSSSTSELFFFEEPYSYRRERYSNQSMDKRSAIPEYQSMDKISAIPEYQVRNQHPLISSLDGVPCTPLSPDGVPCTPPSDDGVRIMPPYRGRSYSTQSTLHYESNFSLPLRGCTISNPSLCPFSSLLRPVSNMPSPLSSTTCHERRRRSQSDPSAPPLPWTFDIVQGYEHTTGTHSVVMVPPSSPLYQIPLLTEPPPPYEEKITTEDTNRDTEIARLMERCWIVPNQHHTYNPEWLQSMNISQHCTESRLARTLSEEDAEDALAKFVTSNCCYNDRVTRHMQTKEILPSNGHQYILETFYEERSTSWHQEPYSNQVIDGRQNGQPPAAWNIYVPKPNMFHGNEVHMEVPHTASVKDCSCCHGKGNKQCIPCHGSGDINCSVCDGLGITHHYTQDDISGLERRTSTGCRSCHHCSGGRRHCHHCSGTGRSICLICQGNGRVKVFIRLTVKWKIMKAHKVLERTKLPNKCITEVSGTIVFQEQNDRVYSLINFPEDEINVYSRKIINSHEEQLRHARIVMQRHCVREVPVAEVRSQWKRQQFTYWVYGNENQVYCPDYPAKCYFGCNIL